jgi:hypothetical protein
MKFLKIIPAIAMVAAITSSCNSSDNKGTGSDSSSVKHDSVTTTSAKPSNILVVMHKVANFDKWLPVFEADEAKQKEAGLTRTVIGRGMDDSNMVLIGFRMDDYEKAKAMGKSAELEKKMKESGVMSEPKMIYMNTQLMDTNTNSMVDRVIVTEKVKDYDTWRPMFDSRKSSRMSNGLTDRGIGYTMDDKNSIVLVFGITDKAKADAYNKSPELKAARDAAGVIGTPEWFKYHVVKQYK